MKEEVIIEKEVTSQSEVASTTGLSVETSLCEVTPPGGFTPSRELKNMITSINYLVNEDRDAYDLLGVIISLFPIASIDHLETLKSFATTATRNKDYNPKNPLYRGTDLAKRGEAFMVLLKFLDDQRQLDHQWISAKNITDDMMSKPHLEQVQEIVSNAAKEIKTKLDAFDPAGFENFVFELYNDEGDKYLESTKFIRFATSCTSVDCKPTKDLITALEYIEIQAKMILQNNPDPSKLYIEGALNLLFCYPPLVTLRNLPFNTISLVKRYVDSKKK